MRELKFRMYSPIENKMHKPVVWQDFNTNDYLVGDIITQYTGLKDENEVEIYEGDILRDYYGNFHIVSYSKGFYEATPILLGDCKPLSDLCNCSFIVGNKFENKEFLNEAT